MGGAQRRAGEHQRPPAAHARGQPRAQRRQPGPAVGVGERRAAPHPGDVRRRVEIVGVEVLGAETIGECRAHGTLAGTRGAHEDHPARGRGGRAGRVLAPRRQLGPAPAGAPHPIAVLVAPPAAARTHRLGGPGIEPRLLGAQRQRPAQFEPLANPADLVPVLAAAGKGRGEHRLDELVRRPVAVGGDVVRHQLRTDEQQGTERHGEVPPPLASVGRHARLIGTELAGVESHGGGDPERRLALAGEPAERPQGGDEGPGHRAERKRMRGVQPADGADARPADDHRPAAEVGDPGHATAARPQSRAATSGGASGGTSAIQRVAPALASRPRSICVVGSMRSRKGLG